MRTKARYCRTGCSTAASWPGRDTAPCTAGLSRTAGLIASGLVLFGSLASAPAAAPSSTPEQDAVTSQSAERPVRVPLSHLYRHFLAYQSHLDRAAAAREKEGKDGDWLRSHYQGRLGFTNSQFANVRATAVRLDSELKVIDAQAEVLVRQDRAWRQVQGAARSTPAPGHAQVQQLRKERDALIQSEVDNLNQALGPDSSAKLQDFIVTEWTRHVTVHRPGLRPRDSKGHPPVSNDREPPSKEVQP